MNGPWRRHPRLARGLGRALTFVAAGAMFFLVDRYVRATPNGPTREALSFAGTLKQNGMPLMGQQTLAFAFKKQGQTLCTPQAVTTPDAQSGAFAVEIPLGNCPATLFDGGDVVFDVAVGGSLIAGNQPVNPVPYAKYADRVGTADCPMGYARDINAGGFVLCKKGADEMVKVGTGATAFWIDRYEAALTQNPDGTGNQYGVAANDAHMAGFARNGQWVTPLFAVSKANVKPSGYIDWFQANEACRLAGKRLPTSDEWFAAARGTVDPGVSNGANGVCATMGNGARAAGAGTSCVSAWGAQDMIGNLEEFTAEWHPGVGAANTTQNAWPNDFNGDGTWNVTSSGFTPPNGAPTLGLPVVTLRGGHYLLGLSSGLFAVDHNWSPAYSDAVGGVRCVATR